jgi:hypothetical protein
MSAENATVREIALLAEGSEGFARRLDVVEHADEADEGRSALLRRLRSRGRAACVENERRRASPAVLSSAFTYRPSPLIGEPFDGPPVQAVVRILAQAIAAIASAGAGPDLGERNLGMSGISGGAGAGMLIVEVQAIAVEPADEADRRLRACSLSAYRSTIIWPWLQQSECWRRSGGVAWPRFQFAARFRWLRSAGQWRRS